MAGLEGQGPVWVHVVPCKLPGLAWPPFDCDMGAVPLEGHGALEGVQSVAGWQEDPRHGGRAAPEGPLVLSAGLPGALSSRALCWLGSRAHVWDSIPVPSTLCITRTAICSLPFLPALGVLLPKPQRLRKAFAAGLCSWPGGGWGSLSAGEVAREEQHGMPRLRAGPWWGTEARTGDLPCPPATVWPSLCGRVGPPSSHLSSPTSREQPVCLRWHPGPMARRWGSWVFNVRGGAGPSLTCGSLSDERKMATEISSRLLKRRGCCGVSSWPPGGQRVDVQPLEQPSALPGAPHSPPAWAGCAEEWSGSRDRAQSSLTAAWEWGPCP